MPTMDFGSWRTCLTIHKNQLRSVGGVDVPELPFMRDPRHITRFGSMPNSQSDNAGYTKYDCQLREAFERRGKTPLEGHAHALESFSLRRRPLSLWGVERKLKPSAASSTADCRSSIEQDDNSAIWSL